MVVALPNPHGMREEDFTLFESSSQAATAITTEVQRLETPYHQSKIPVMPGFGGRSFGAARGTPPPPLMVQQAGAYKISIAPSLEDLESRAPWAAFGVDTRHAYRILSDMRLKYSSGFAFVIAEGNVEGESGGSPFIQSSFHSYSGISRRPIGEAKQYGFGVMYRDGRGDGCFFPTSHEVPLATAVSNVPSAHIVEMDVTCLALGSIIRPSSILTGAQHAAIKFEPIDQNSWGPNGMTDPAKSELRPVEHVVLCGDDLQCVSLQKPKWGSIRTILQHLTRRGTKGLHENAYVQHERVALATVWKLKGQFLNRDVYGRKATQMDEAVTSRLLADFDAWACLRLEHSESQLQANASNVTPKGPSRHNADPFSPFGPSVNGNGVDPFRPQTHWDSRQRQVADSDPFGAHRNGVSGARRDILAIDGASAFKSRAPNNKLDLALAFLVRQLADPGIYDRASDVPCPYTGVKKNCGPVAFMNLDLIDIDLDEASYKLKRSHARHIGGVDTKGTTFLRISASLGEWESIEQRTV